MRELPILTEIADKVFRNELLTELESFIFAHQPEDEIDCYKWRCDLQDLINVLTTTDSMKGSKK